MGSPCVLVVDDAAKSFQQVTEILEKRGYRVLTATEQYPDLAQKVGAFLRTSGVVPAQGDVLQLDMGEGEVPGILGDLKEFALSSLLILLELERKSGVLLVEQVDPPGVGRVYLRDGHIIAAQQKGVQALVGEPAIHEMLTWTSGQFLFQRAEVRVSDEVNLSITQVLMERARQLDERGRVVPAPGVRSV